MLQLAVSAQISQVKKLRSELEKIANSSLTETVCALEQNVKIAEVVANKPMLAT
jgi:hypothetical protein